ncbi:MAG: hypothetical protein HUK02_10520, partial [Bacteroidaceae bacterium]|nr:hypothetical protein [Bacteroidaceae bacterium]
YTVNTAATTSGITAVSDKLCWGTGEHTFFATYGDGLTMKDAANGIIKCPYDETTSLKELKSGTYTNENMKQAYMVSTLTTRPTNSVTLHFKPIKTTLKLTVKGMADETHGTNLYLHAVWVTLKNKGKLYKENGQLYYDYDIANETALDATTPVTDDITFKYTFTKPQAIAKYGTITLELLLPPVDIAAGDLTISVKSAGWGENVAKNAKAFKAGKKITMTLPNFEFRDRVDLGLASGLKWATFNVGAGEKPTEYGSYFLWGKTDAKTGSYSTGASQGYDYYGVDLATLRSQGIINQNDDNLILNYDAAYKNMVSAKTNKGDWRMPTYAESQELQGTHSEQTFNGTKGLLFISSNDNCLFLPFSGYHQKTWASSYVSTAYFHHTTTATDVRAQGGDVDGTHTFGMAYDKDNKKMGGAYNSRVFAHPIRAVYNK